MARILVGIGGWTYAPWRGAFYPPGLPHAQELHFASRQVTSIEINGTFYGAQKPESFAKWREAAPDGFVFSVKGPRYATHRRNLAESGPSIERFLGGGVLELADTLGPILWQLPPTMRFSEENIAAFLGSLPESQRGRPLRHVLEVRHESFADPRFEALLRARNVAVVEADSEKQPRFEMATADFTYLRLKRAVETETTGYPPAELAGWRERARAAKGDVFLYFINGAKVRAPAAAMAFIRMLGV